MYSNLNGLNYPFYAYPGLISIMSQVKIVRFNQKSGTFYYIKTNLQIRLIAIMIASTMSIPVIQLVFKIQIGSQAVRENVSKMKKKFLPLEKSYLSLQDLLKYQSCFQ